jgi:Uma2 family endonuclease
MQATITRYSVEEYLEREKTAEFRNEYRDGEIIPMTGGTPNHNQIAGNFYAALMPALKDQPYRVFMNDVRLSIPDKNSYAYPDVMVVPSPLVYAENRRDTITNAQIIVEVLSPSTEVYDRSKKFESYRSVDSFREYLLVDYERCYMEQFTKTEDGKWLLSVYSGEDAVLSLSSVEFQISLADVYENVEFE